MTKATTAKFAKQRVTLPTINVKEAGYLFTYLSYEDQSNNYVYFDDYKVTYTPTNIVQYNEYYPYGLQTATSWTRENATGNNFLGNGGTELNTTTSLYDLEYRNYDPALARMHQVDPMADKYASYTPYNYGFNAPSNFNDVNGADPYSRDDYWREESMQRRAPLGGSYVHNDMSTYNNFVNNGLSNIISQWNPDYGGPLYLGKDQSGSAIFALPTEIERAGGAQSYVNQVYTGNLVRQAWAMTSTTSAGVMGYFEVANGSISKAMLTFTNFSSRQRIASESLVASLDNSLMLDPGTIIGLQSSFITISFNRGADNNVNPKLAKYFGTIAEKASQSYITSLNVSATTNGHSGRRGSGHRRDNGGRAVDISLINGVGMSKQNPNACAEVLQDIISNTPGYLENYGPFKVKKITSYGVVEADWARDESKTPGGHYDHIHFSVDW